MKFILTLALMAPQILLAANQLHPKFDLLNARGELIKANTENVSTEQTCNQCHQVEFIQKENTHFNQRVQVSCTECHLGLPGFGPATTDARGHLLAQTLEKISRPKNSACANCHGAAYEGAAPFAMDLATLLWSPKWAMTRNTGMVLSSQEKRQSAMNLEGKEFLAGPWDIHTQRQVRCIDCHFSSNSPRHGEVLSENREKQHHLQFDPRTLGTSDYLKKPSHRLHTASCTSCHNPLEAHDHLAFKELHFAALDCRSCHIPEINSPILEELDTSVRTSKMLPRAVFRNLKFNDQQNLENELSTTYVQRIRPELAMSKDGKIWPVNRVRNTYWADQKDHPLDAKIVDAAFTQILTNDKVRYLRMFDGDNNGIIDFGESILDRAEKKEFIAAAVSAQTKSPVRLVSEIEVRRLTHGVVRGANVIRDCKYCHSSEGALFKVTSFSGAIPYGVGSIQPNNNSKDLSKDLENLPRQSVYIAGSSGWSWADQLGLLAIVLTIVGVTIHAMVRYLGHSQRTKAFDHRNGRFKRVYMYSFYERFWHWLNAFSIMALMVTGFEIHFGGATEILGFSSSVFIHNILAVILVLNGFLSLFYHLASKEIRQYLPPVTGFSEVIMQQIQYYLVGIFKGSPHPLEKTPDRKLNPLQQITYLFLLNLLIPFQILTGVWMWSIEQWPGLVFQSEQLAVLGPIHTLGSWLLLQFLLMHIYLTTTGRTLTSNMKAMVVGYEDVDGSH